MANLYIVGLGPGNPELVTRQAWSLLSSASEVYLRTRVHPTVESLPQGPVYHSFDEIYESSDRFQDVYDLIVGKLIAQLEQGADVIYAVPGDPMVAEGTVSKLVAVCRVKQFPVKLVHGISFVEPALAALDLDGVDGLQLLDALDVAVLHHPPIDPDRGALLAQVYNNRIASNVKLTLMNQYPDDHPVTLLHAVGMDDQIVETIPLYELDRKTSEHLTALYIPPLRREPESALGFAGFQETIAHLRAPEGCPWDREQTHESLRPYLIEEAYEVLDAIDKGDPDHLAEELGDLLLQVVLHTQIAVDEGEFQMPDVIWNIDSKIKRRHPHVWGDVNVDGNPERVVANWDQIKASERADKSEVDQSLLDGVSLALPALMQAYEYDRRASRAGFDWQETAGVVAKVREELDEVLKAADDRERFNEIGDLLLAVVVLSRWLKVAPEDALRVACKRFYNRFTWVENSIEATGRKIADVGFEELNELWGRAKAATAIISDHSAK